MTAPRNNILGANSLYEHIEGRTNKPKKKPPTIKPKDLVHVIWEDAICYGCEQWENETIPQLATTHSVGWVIETTATKLTIVTLVNEHAYGNGITIPTKTIKTITKIGDDKRI